MFEPELFNLSAVEAAESRRQAAECSNQCELCGDEVDDEAELRLLCKRQAMLGLALPLVQRIARDEKVRVQVGAQHVAGVRSPFSFAASKARRTRSRQHRTWLIQRTPKAEKHR